jgi:hypothetical protein
MRYIGKIVSVFLFIVMYYGIGVFLLRTAFKLGFDIDVGIVAPIIFIFFANWVVSLNLMSKVK